jgi:O-acetylhomoserine (thiol)-lyase
MNPTTDVFEQRMALLEGASGRSRSPPGRPAETLAILNLAGAGDEIVSAAALYGGTYTSSTTRSQDRHQRQVRRLTDPGEHPRGHHGQTKAVYAETVGNPALHTLDIRALGCGARGWRPAHRG